MATAMTMLSTPRVRQAGELVGKCVVDAGRIKVAQPSTADATVRSRGARPAAVSDECDWPVLLPASSLG